VTVTLTCSTAGAEVRVRDTGPGIPEDDLPHIFERFFRGDAARDRSAGSTGLGLSIGKRLAEAHRGSLTARNHPDGGAEFILRLN
jgi:signal transduction histidine kinase